MDKIKDFVLTCMKNRSQYSFESYLLYKKLEDIRADEYRKKIQDLVNS